MFNKLFKKTNGTKALPQQLTTDKIPQHIAIIMDGNGRWANKRLLPRIAGHKEGMDTVKKITMAASKLGVEVLTLYAFSTENWKRPTDEVQFLMKLPVDFFDTFMPELMAENVRVNVMGYHDALPLQTQNVVKQAMETTKNNTGLVLNFALNYGGRAEIISAAQSAMRELLAENGTVEQLTEERLAAHLMTSSYPEPDLLIRTSGEMRVSNFMLWQIAYSEFYFVDKHWPDFNAADLTEAVATYQHRTRRFGGISK
ncbi:isoprenyl transferase [Brochothrix campestris]